MTSVERAFPALLQDFFHRRLVAQRGASAHTIASYRDTFTLFLGYAAQRIGRTPSALTVSDLDAPMVLDFLDHLETERGNSPRSRNLRLTAIRSFMRSSPTCFSIARRPCSCTARDARSVSSRSGRAPQRSSGRGSLESIEAPVLPCFPIAPASPCRAPGLSINCASPAERPRRASPHLRPDGSRLTRYATRPRCICSSRESTSPSLHSGSATRTRPPPISTSKPTSP